MKHLKLFFALFAMLALGVGNAWGAGTWTLVKDASTLSAGDKVIIVAKDKNFAMSTTQNSNNRGQVAVTKDGETLTYTTAVQELTLKDGKTSGTLAFYTGSGYLNAASSSKNYLKTETTLTANSSWTITVANTGVATIKATGSYTRNWLRYNSSSSIFACYASGQGDVCLYKYVEEQGGGNEETAVSVPTFSVPEGTFYSPINVELSCSTADAEIYYTLDGNTPSSTSEKYTTAIAISETTTIKAIAVKDGLTDSEVATATYTKGETVTSYDIDFETNALEAYVNWDFSNITITTTTIKAKAGTYYANTSGKASASIKTKEKIQYPGILTFSVSKESTNTTASNWLVQVSENGTTWSTVGTISATEMTKGNWKDHSVDLSDYENVYVQISYGSSTAVRAIDEISLAQGVAPVKYTLTIENPENGTLSVTKGGVSVASGEQFKAGTSLVVTPTPASGYLFESLTVDGSEVELSEGKYTFTMPENDVTISATFKANEKPAATLTLSKNGETELLPGNHKQDDVVTLPDFESDCSKTFVGWSESQNCNTEPEYKAGDSYQLKLEGNQTLYAVYADEKESTTTEEYTFQSFTSAQNVTLNSTSFTVKLQKGSGSTNPAWNAGSSEARIYAKGLLTIESTTPIVKVVYTYTINKNSSGKQPTIDGVAGKNNAGTWDADAKTWTGSDSEVTLSTSGDAGNIGFKKVAVTLGTIGFENYSTTCAAAPIATVTPTSVTTTASSAEGKVTVTYENVNTANVAVALYNDEACTETFTAGWLTASIDADKNITYTVEENTTYAERKAYIKLTAPETNGATEPAVVVIPVTQAAKDKVFASLAELVAADLTAGDEVTVTLNNDVIKDFYIYSSKRCGVVFDVQKDGKDIKIYFNSQTTIDDWAVGGKLSGTLTNVKWTTYSSAWQLAPANTWAWANLTYTEPKAVSTVVVSGAPTKTTYVDGETFDPAGLTVTVNYNDATTEVNPTGVTFTVTPTTLVKGQTSVSVTATYNSVTSEAYTVNNLIVTDIQSMTILDFITSGGTRCYLEGIVSNITNTTYGNFDLTDESGTIYVYGCLNAAGESKKFADLRVKNGDKIKVIANESSLYEGKTQTKDVQYVSHKSAATIEVEDITMEVGDKQTISATVTPEGASVTYAIKAGSDNCITLNVAEIIATAAGTATIVATIAETADYMGAEKEFTVTVTAVDTRKKAVSPSPFTATSGELNPNDITFASYKGGAGTDPGIYNYGIRLYQISGTNTYGGYITLTAVKGCMIDQVEITTTDQYETTTVAYSVDDNVTLLGSASVAQLGKYSTPAGLNTESVNILNLGTTNKNRLEIASIIVYYTGQPLADPELSWTSNTVVLRVGETFTAPTLNNPYNVTGITYSSDNESLVKVNETTGAVTLVPDATGTATITAKFGGNDTYKAVEVSYTIIVNPALVYGVWELVTDVNSLAAGDKVVIVAKDYNFALSINQGNNNRGQAAVIKSNDDNTISFSADVQVLTLEAGTVDNTFALNTGNGYLYASSTSANQLKTQKTKDANASWKITITDGTASIVAQGTNSRSTMQYNQSSSLFACYSSASQQAVCLYTKKNVKVEGETDNTSIPNQSDVTVDNAELTVTTEAEYDNMYIGNNGSVDVEETVTVNNLYIQTTMGTTTSGQLNTAPENLIVNGDAFIDITLGKNGDPNQWHAFTVPFPVDAMNGIFDLNDNKLTNGVNYAIMQYHGDVRAQGKYGWKKYSGVLVPGTFYLMTVDGARTTYRFKKVEDAAIVAPATKAITAFTGSGDPEKDKGWNGVGNPTLKYGKVAYDAQILDPQSYTYVTVPASSAHFTVGTPFFIQAAADGAVAITAEGNSSLAPARRAAAAVDKVKVMLGNADYTDYLYVSASEDATNDYEIGKDLVKMVMTNTPIVPQIFAEAYGARLCMVNAPMTSNEATVALNLYAPTEGEYTLSVEEQAGATVYLLYNGNIVWNLSMSEYPIHLSQGNNAGYSLVVRRENAPTDVENIFGADEQTEKFIYNGNLYILHEGKVFDAVGNVLK